MRKFLRGFLGIALLVAFVVCIYLWETHFKQVLIYTNVIVLKQDTAKNTLITKDMLTIKKEEKPIKNAIINPKDIIGLETQNFVPGNVQLVKNYFDKASVVLEEGEYIFSLPFEHIKSFPDTVRRGDKVYFYTIDKSVLVENDEEQLNKCMTYEDIIKQYKNVIDKDSLFSTTVQFVKDNANREVRTVSNEERYDGSSKINKIEIKVNAEMLDLFFKCIENNKEFVILYN